MRVCSLHLQAGLSGADQHGFETYRAGCQQGPSTSHPWPGPRHRHIPGMSHVSSFSVSTGRFPSGHSHSPGQHILKAVASFDTPLLFSSWTTFPWICLHTLSTLCLHTLGHVPLVSLGSSFHPQHAQTWFSQSSPHLPSRYVFVLILPGGASPQLTPAGNPSSLDLSPLALPWDSPSAQQLHRSLLGGLLLPFLSPKCCLILSLFLICPRNSITIFMLETLNVHV